MADIRIKDLTTEAPNSLTGDFLPIDGSTGTRKLSAFSPSFGGNATVGGTLTVNGSGDSTLTGPLSWGTTVPVNALLLYKTGTTKYGNGLTSGSWNNFVPAGGNKHSWGYMSTSDGTSYTELATLTANTGVMAVLGTTASNNTSSGALVVGNGTSGGLGVGGNIHLGGDLNLNSASGQIVVSGTGNTANSKEVRLYRSDGGDWAVFGLTGTAYAGSLTGLGNSEAFIYNTNPLRIFIGTGATNRYDFASNQFKINATTASTGTSSGALVVSGGVGVAGAIYAGGVLSTVSGAGFNTPDWRFYQSGTSGYIRDLVNGQMALQFVSGSASTIQVYATGTQDSTSTTSGAFVSSGGLGVAGAVNAGTFFGLVDGVTAPATAGGYARIYVDSADGDLKIKFGDGTVKTIATDS